MSTNERQVVKIKPSLVPYVWRGFVLLLVGLVMVVATLAFQFQLVGVILGYVAVGVIALGLVDMLFGLLRRNAYTYTLTRTDLVVERQLLSRSVRRIPFSSISDVEIGQTFIGRLAGYGNIAPVTKSGYGLVRGVERSENIVAEMINVPEPDKVAQQILLRASQLPQIPAA